MIPSICRKYAAALADVAGDREVARQVLEELKSFLSHYSEHEELRQALGNPALPLSVKQSILRELAEKAGWQVCLKNFFLVLEERDRIDQIPEIVAAYEEILDDKAGIVRVEVESARALSKEIKDQLDRTMESLTGKEVKLSYSIREELLGGLRLRLGSLVYDGSIQTELQELKRRLTV